VNIDVGRGIDKVADTATEAAVGVLYDTCCRGSLGLLALRAKNAKIDVHEGESGQSR
jgi:hypothetical protein